MYLNVGGVLQTQAGWVSGDSDATSSIAWGDVDGDGDLDLAAGNGGPNKVYLNDGGVLQTQAAWVSGDSNATWSIAWGDVDGDGDLDLAAGNWRCPQQGVPQRGRRVADAGRLGFRRQRRHQEHRLGGRGRRRRPGPGGWKRLAPNKVYLGSRPAHATQSGRTASRLCRSVHRPDINFQPVLEGSGAG